MTPNEQIEEITHRIRAAIGAQSGLDATLKFDFEGQGIIHVDGKSNPNTVTNDDGPADCVITVGLDTFRSLAKGEMDATTAFMSGKLKVSNIGIAMKLGPFFQRARG